MTDLSETKKHITTVLDALKTTELERDGAISLLRSMTGILGACLDGVSPTTLQRQLHAKAQSYLASLDE